MKEWFPGPFDETPSGCAINSQQKYRSLGGFISGKEMSHLYSTLRDKEKVFQGSLVTLWHLKLMDSSAKSEDLKSE